MFLLTPMSSPISDELFVNGTQRLTQGDIAVACVLLGQAVELLDSRYDCWLNYAIALTLAARNPEAQEAYRRARILAPENHAVLSNYATFLLQQPASPEVQEIVRAAVASDIGDAAGWSKLGTLLQRDPNPATQQESKACFMRCVELNPTYAFAWNSLGLLHLQECELGQAVRCFEQAIEADPAMFEAEVNLSLALMHQGRLEVAIDKALHAHAQAPTQPAALTNAALAHMLAGNPDAAIHYLRRAVGLDPRDAQLSFNLAVGLLLVGEWEEGWQHYESRLQTPALKPESLPVPIWTGQSLENKRILLTAEQGFGDSLQFVRYVSPLVEMGAQVWLRMPSPLMRIARSVTGVCGVTGELVPDTPIDYFCPLPSVPQRVGTRPDTIPLSNIPYLYPDPIDVDKWARRLAPFAGRRFRVGLIWHGSSRRDSNDVNLILTDARRSMSLSEFEPLALIPNTVFVSLQKPDRPELSEKIPAAFVGKWFDAMHEVSDFADTAALIHNLDLVITVDTAVAHLAGALNKPVWMLNRLDSCWRWLLGRDDGVWYGSMRQFRQVRYGEWAPVVRRVAVALDELVQRQVVPTLASPALD